MKQTVTITQHKQPINQSKHTDIMQHTASKSEAKILLCWPIQFYTLCYCKT